ncbi:MAG TPA: deoxyguanosinetriphosphate triphosphohydrolase [Steroidobacteraceae bacterium]
MARATPQASALAPYAAAESASRGRRFPETPPQFRGEYQRDRDRIIHSNAFRRLVYKTQVFVNHEGDLYRTRLTHSMEVAQIARSIASALQLNETLTEAICLAHDLGHTPFGHAGQDALNACMRRFGGFEHNLQSLRVVDELEDRYADFHGLNLTFECREGILKHCSVRNAKQLGELGERFIKRRQPSLEAQLSNLADEIAYNNHDVADGLRAGLISLDDLAAVELFESQHRSVLAKYGTLPERKVIHETIRRIINHVVSDLIRTTADNLAKAAPTSITEVRARAKPLVSFSPDVAREQLKLKRFLNERVYRHYKVLRMTSKARLVVTRLFDTFLQDATLMPPEHQESAAVLERELGIPGRARAVADYIAGMTDRYAILEHRRLFDPAERT